MASRVGPFEDPDRYILIELTSRGGEGELWRATIAVDGQALPVAIKIVHRTQARMSEWSERWRLQAELLRSLEHPGLVKVREVFEGPLPHEEGAADPSIGTVFLVMNWAQGESGPVWVANHPDRDVLEVTRILSRVASALDYLHSGRATGGVAVLHRDIKPANVIIDRGEVRLVDFGFARLAGDQITMAGTPAYLAPEVLAGAPPGKAADRYALGGTAYFLFTGKDPTPNDRGAMRAALTGITGLEGREDIADHLLAMMARDPARRPTNVIEWAQALAVGAVSERMPDRPAAGQPEEVKSGGRSRSRLIAVLVAIMVVLGVVAGYVLTRKSPPGTPLAATSPIGAASSPLAAATDSPTPTPSLSGTPSATASPAPVGGVTPNVVGQELSSALNTLQAAGLTSAENDVVDSAHTDGTVVAQSPAAGAPVTSTVTLQVARLPVGTFLADMSTVSGGDSPAIANISGKTYTRSLELGTLGGFTNSLQAGYNLSRDYQQLVATVGLSDLSDSAAKVDFQILGDGRALFDQTLGLGHAVPVKIDVTGVLRLVISATLINSQAVNSDSYAVFGDIEVFGTPSQVYRSPSPADSPTP